MASGSRLATIGGALIDFFDSSNAGAGTFTTQAGTVSEGFGGTAEFYDNSTAGNGTFINQGASHAGAVGGDTTFWGDSSGGSGTFTADAATVAGGHGGYVRFFERSNAGSGTYIAHGSDLAGAGPGSIEFFSGSASDATLIADGGSNGGHGGAIFLTDFSDGGAARVQLFDHGHLDISSHEDVFPSPTIGSLEGNGAVFLGAFNLSVGSNNLSTVFDGVIEDGGSGGGTGGSLTKVGTGTLVLTRVNSYTGGTFVDEGTLLVKGRRALGDVKVNTGTLGGTGTISGRVIVGTGSGSGAFLSPGLTQDTLRSLTIRGSLTFESDATFTYELDSDTANADRVVANGVIITGAFFSFTDKGNGSLSLGSVIILIDNVAASPISGTFSNLADGSIFTVGNNTFQANYEGGDGNDLTLTVVP